ncbi:MAG: hypothetical protein ACI4KM_00010 [Oscillospiraceae bacterium]
MKCKTTIQEIVGANIVRPSTPGKNPDLGIIGGLNDAEIAATGDQWSPLHDFAEITIMGDQWSHLHDFAEITTMGDQWSPLHDFAEIATMGDQWSPLHDFC